MQIPDFHHAAPQVVVSFYVNAPELLDFCLELCSILAVGIPS
jgi:hypothetical protein